MQPVAIFNSSPYVTEMLNYFLSWLCPSYITQTLFDIIIPLQCFLDQISCDWHLFEVQDTYVAAQVHFEKLLISWCGTIE